MLPSLIANSFNGAHLDEQRSQKTSVNSLPISRSSSVPAPVRRPLQFYPGAKTARRGAAGHRPFRISTFVCAHIRGTGSECPCVAGTCVRGWHRRATRGTGGGGASPMIRHKRERQSRRDQEPRRYTPRIPRLHVDTCACECVRARARARE